MSKRKMLSFIQFIKRFPDEKACEMYLDEFCYRFNRRKFAGDIFDRLLVAIVG